jgi:choline dehydrogenase-like flavoprotein
VRIVVVGAGPAGATLSLLLARHGADVRLLEREPTVGGAFRGEGLLPLGLDALQQMGLGAALREVPGQVVTRWRIWIDGDEVLTVPEPVAELGEHAFRIVSPAALLGRVLDAAGEFPNFSFHPDTRFTDVVRSAGRVVGVGAATGGRGGALARRPRRRVRWPRLVGTHARRARAAALGRRLRRAGRQLFRRRPAGQLRYLGRTTRRRHAGRRTVERRAARIDALPGTGQHRVAAMLDWRHGEELWVNRIG